MSKISDLPKLQYDSDLDDWITEVRMWQCETVLEKNEQGPAMYMKLNEIGQECCKEIELDDLTSADGPEFVLSALNAFYNTKIQKFYAIVSSSSSEEDEEQEDLEILDDTNIL